MSKHSKRLDASQIETRMIPIDLIDDHEENYNFHPDEQIAQLARSHAEFGQYRSITVWARPNGRYTRVVGHGYSHGAKREGETMLRCEVYPEDTPPETIKAIMLADNLHAQNSQPDEELLSRLLQEQHDAGYDLAALGSDEETLRQMLESLGDEYLGEQEEGDGGDEFDTTPDEEQTRVRVGDVWQCGRHKIGCLNSLDAEQVKQLVGDTQIDFTFADPPYGINIVATNGYVGGGEAYDIPFGGVKNRGDVGGGASHIRKTGMSYLEASKKGLRGSDGASKPFGSKHVHGTDGATNIVEAGKYFPIIGDDSTATAITAYRLCAELFPKALHIWWGANYYANALPPSSCWIVWDKENTGNFADVELAWCSHKGAAKLFRHMWNGMLKASEHGQRRVHPSQKPVMLASWTFTEFGQSGDVIFDPFLGSGISVIAAERLGDRTVIGCELSADYINVVLSRWEAETGAEATLLSRVEEAVHG